MRSFLHAILWLIKGTLGVIALAMLALWGLGHARHGYADLNRFTVKSERVDFVGFDAAWWDGRLGIGRWREHYTGDSLSTGQVIAARHVPGWQREFASGRPWWADGNWPSSTGAMNPPQTWTVFRWQSYSVQETDTGTDARYVSAPCWLGALASGAWPVVSFALLLRGRSRRRRLAGIGCCRQCGYDLRATPEAGGELVRQCPECGWVAARIDRSLSRK